MRRLIQSTAACVALTFLFAATGNAQTLDDIISKNLASKGGLEKIRSTSTVKMTGKVKAQGQEVPMTMWAKRPNMMRREATVQGKSMVNAFDGHTLWVSQGTAPATELPGPQAAYAKQDAEFDSVFVDYKEKGHTIELVGTETADGKKVHHLRVTRKGGPPQEYFLDADTGLEKKMTMTIDQGGTPVKVVVEFADYREIDGRMVPFITRQLVNGNVVAATEIDKVEFNVPVEDAIFKMPK